MANLRLILPILFLLAFGAVPPPKGPFPAAIPAQDQSEPNGAIKLQSPEEIQNKLQAKIKEIENLSEIEETLKGKVLDLYRQALGRLETVKANQKNAEEFKQSVEIAPGETKRIQKELDESVNQSSNEDAVAVPPEATAQELEARLAKEQAEHSAMKSKLAETETRIKDLRERPALARKQLAEAKQKQEEIEKELKVPPPGDENPMLTEARKAHLDARKLSRTTETVMLEQDLLSIEARLGLHRVWREKYTRLVSQAEGRIKRLQKVIPEIRTAEAKKARAEADQARREAIDKDPVVSDLADKNLELSDLRLTLEKEIQEASQKRQQSSEALKQVEQKFNDAKRKAEIAGLSRILGEVLREQSKNLPNTRDYFKEMKERKEKILTARLMRIEIEEMQREVSVPEQAVKRVMEDVDKNLPPENKEEIEKAITDRVLAQKEILSNLGNTYHKYILELGELDSEQQQLIFKAREYNAFLDQRLLWIPSTIPVGKTTLQNLKTSLLWIVEPKAWMGVGREVLADLSGFPALKIITLLAFIALLFSRFRLLKRMETISEKVAKVRTDSFWLTLQALFITVLLAAPFPLFIYCIGWAAGESFDAPDFSKAVGAGLLQAAVLLLAIQFIRLLCRHRGVGAVHFKWPEGSLELFQKSLFRLMLILLPVEFLVSAIEWKSSVSLQDGIGRLAFTIGMAALSMFIYRVFNPGKGIFKSYMDSNPKGWASRFRYVWFFALVSLPLVLVVLSAAGYHYTALQLKNRLFSTILLSLCAAFMYSLLKRWLYVARRKLAVAQAREKRKAAAAEERDSGGSESKGEPSLVVHEIPELDLATISQQTRHLLQAVIVISSLILLWLVWADVLPALKIFEEVTLWHYKTVVDGAEQLRPITLAAMALAILSGIITVVASRNVPGVLEIGILQRLPLDAGSRYAIITISRYLIIAIGFIVGFGFIGIGWSSVQWLVAAVGIGLGFGLQEIFANFVSGVIILFERPIRLGDTVTVGDVNGTVSRIRIRATTITDWNRKELIVPNKTFITGQLINWSLSDQITRLVIDVGIAYGSDTDLAYKVLLETAKAHPLVLEDPPPGVYFLGFGDSALTFSVRFYVKELTQRFQTFHDLHMAIDKTLRKHKIEIAFPQRDLHLRSAKAPIIIGKKDPPGEVETNQ